MSTATTRVLAEAAGTWTGSTLGSLILYLRLAEREALAAWDEGVDLHNRSKAA